jgi:hypothetical protein
MTDFDGARVRARLLTGGYAQAHDRFRAAMAVSDVETVFYALFEALDWAHAVDDLIALTWSPRGKVQGYAWRRDPALGGGDGLANIMGGLRYVRNRVHHQWADALVVDGGLPFPINLPATFSAFLWRPASDLPTPPNEGREAPGRTAYAKALAGRRADDALEEMRHAFTFIGQLLDPPIARRRAGPTVESLPS